MNAFFEQFLASLRSAGKQDWSEIFKALEPIIQQQSLAKANDVWYGTDIVLANVNKLVANGLPVDVAKDIVLAVYAEKGFAEELSETIGEMINKLVPSMLSRNDIAVYSEAEADWAPTECGKCGSAHVMADSGLCAACYVGETGAN